MAKSTFRRSASKERDAVFRCSIAMLLAAMVALLAGCYTRPADSLANVNGPITLARYGNAYLLRGWRDLYSTGVDTLAQQLESTGVHATVFHEAQWSALADALAQRYGNANTEPFVLIGFSYGADNAIAIARRLQSRGVSVPLLITIDPVTPDRVPDNVVTCYNFYQTNGVMDVFPFFRGIPLTADDAYAIRLININIHTRPELENPTIGHRTIAASEPIHQAIIEQVLRYCPPRSATRPTTAPPF